MPFVALLLALAAMIATWFLLPRVQQPSQRTVVTVLFVCASFVTGYVLAAVLFAPPSVGFEIEQTALLKYPAGSAIPYATIFTVAVALIFFLSRNRRHSRPARRTVLFACGAFAVTCILAFVVFAAAAPPGESGLGFVVDRGLMFAMILTVLATFLFSVRRR